MADKFDIRAFSNGAIEAAAKSSNPDRALAAHAAAVADKGHLPLDRAVQIAKDAYHFHNTVKSYGASHETAKIQTADAVEKRYGTPRDKSRDTGLSR